MAAIFGTLKISDSSCSNSCDYNIDVMNLRTTSLTMAQLCAANSSLLTACGCGMGGALSVLQLQAAACSLISWPAPFLAT